MYFIEKTVEFDKWLIKLKDLRAKAKILFRIQKVESDGHFGDCEPVGDGKIILLLIGGDKSTQQKDIEKAKEIWRKIKK
jgi:putative component of toxin-antitoxin plasmid stabilization module